MTKLNKKYVIGTHVMFFEIEMYKDFIEGLVNLLEIVDNKENVIIDLCFNMSEQIENIDYDKISKTCHVLDSKMFLWLSIIFIFFICFIFQDIPRLTTQFFTYFF